jgi:DNA modification methylase
LPDNSIDCCVTSPPYFGLRDYGVSGQIGLEASPEAYVEQLVSVFTEVKRVLKKTGTFWVNIGDSYAGSGRGKGDINKKGTQQKQQKSSYVGDFIKPYRLNGYKNKDLIGIPWLLAFALRENGWYLRQDIIWSKPNPMPEPVRDRCTKSHEHIFLLSKSIKYHFDGEAIQTETQGTEHDKRARIGRKTFPTAFINGIRKSGHYPKANKRDVWTVCTSPEPEAHFACFPQTLIVDCIKAGCPENGTVLDPFMGSGTTAVVARKLNRNYLGFELNPEYMKIADAKLKRELGFFV